MMEHDLISRQKLIDDLEAWRKILDRRVSRFDDMVIHTLPVVFDLVNEQKTVAAEPKWISVKERLPEDDETVLIFLPSEKWSSYINTGRFIHRYKTWFIGDTNAVGGSQPTHWMPLPSVEGLHDD